MHELSVAAVGLDFPNENGTSRRSEATMAPPGAPFELVPERRTSTIRERSRCSARTVCSLATSMLSGRIQECLAFHTLDLRLQSLNRVVVLANAQL